MIPPAPAPADRPEAIFAAALLDPSHAVPAAVEGRPERRFAVYRNNVALSLTGALEARFPAVRRIVGETFFKGLARAFVAAHPPRSPLMMVYGDGFADYLATAPGLDELDYLPDVARLEAARTRAYHAADAEPLGPEAFARLDADALDGLTVALHPSVEVVRSSHPLVTIWTMNAADATPAPIEDWPGEDALVCRPAMDVLVRRLPPGGADFLGALARGATLGEAAHEAALETPTFDLTQNLIGLIEAGLAVRLGGASTAGS